MTRIGGDLKKGELAMKRIWSGWCVGLALLCGLGELRAEDGDGERYQKLLEKVAPSVVTVKIVVKMEMNFGGQGNDQEQRQESQGIVVGADGLVMLTYDPFRSDEGGGDNGFQIKRTPTEIKVVFENDEKEFEAEIVATDKKLGLAFVKIKDLEGRAVAPVAFADEADGAMGDKVYAVSRLSKGYDYAPFVSNGIINGAIKKPRKALMVQGGLGGPGLPVYTKDGTVLGVMTTIESGIEDDDGGGFSPFRMFGGGGGGRPFVLPAKVVGKLVEQAAKQAQELGKEGDKKPDLDSGDGAGKDEKDAQDG